MQKSLHFALMLYPGFSALCLANAVEPLRAANMLAGDTRYSWKFLSLEGQTILSSSGMPVQTEPIDDQSGDYLFVMPSYGHRDLDTTAGRRLLKRAATRFHNVIGLDTGSWLLAAAGLLDGFKATSHWDILTALEESFPEIDVVEDRFVLDGSRGSCGGATTTLELMLELIEQNDGPTLMLEVAALFMFGERAPDVMSKKRLSRHQVVSAAAALMRRNIENPLGIEEIANRFGMSQRTLETVFKKHAGQSPHALYKRTRLNEARRRLEQSQESVAEIANRCGYADPTAMTRAFRQTFGMSPSELRRQIS